MQNTNPQIAILPEEIKNFGIGARIYTCLLYTSDAADE